MRKRSAALLFVTSCVLLSAGPAALSQETRGAFRAGLEWTFPTGENNANGIRSRFNTAVGVTLAYEIKYSPLIGLDLSVSYSKPKVEQDGVSADTATKLVPVTLGVNLHPIRSKQLDLYAGPAIAYVNYGGLPASSYASFKNELTWGLRAGADIPFKDSNWGLNFDVLYLRAKSELESNAISDTTKLNARPFFVTFGACYRY